MTKAVKTILVLGADPQDTRHLRIDRESRAIREGIKRSLYRDVLSVEIVFAVRFIDVRRAILDHRPSIVHFCGHGDRDGALFFENESGESQKIGLQALEALFKVFARDGSCVVLNACYSAVLAEVLAKSIDHVVGMTGEINDSSAIDYAGAFYDAVGAGRTFLEAHNVGLSAICQEGLADESKPVLHSRFGAPESLPVPRGLTNRQILQLPSSKAKSDYRVDVPLKYLLEREDAVRLSNHSSRDERVLSLHVGESLVIGRCYQSQLHPEALHRIAEAKVDWVLSWDDQRLSQVVAKQTFRRRRNGLFVGIENLTDYSSRAQNLLVFRDSEERLNLDPGEAANLQVDPGSSVALVLDGSPRREIVRCSLSFYYFGSFALPVICTDGTSFPFRSIAHESSVIIRFLGVWTLLSKTTPAATVKSRKSALEQL